MTMDEYDERNDVAINSYHHYLDKMTPFELFDYFQQMDKADLIECIKFIYGNDGKDDGSFEN